MWPNYNVRHYSFGLITFALAHTQSAISVPSPRREGNEGGRGAIALRNLRGRVALGAAVLTERRKISYVAADHGGRKSKRGNPGVPPLCGGACASSERSKQAKFTRGLSGNEAPVAAARPQLPICATAQALWPPSP